jgi:hypothetical protein
MEYPSHKKGWMIWDGMDGLSSIIFMDNMGWWMAIDHNYIMI